MTRPCDNGGVLDESFQLFPVLKTMLKRRGGGLGGGQQQQLAIARTLVADPKLLLLAEPTEGIQSSFTDEIEDVIGRIKQPQSVSILLVEQYLEFHHARAQRRSRPPPPRHLILHPAASDGSKAQAGL